MNFSHFFIKRPIFAGVLSIAIFMMGLLALFKLPISEVHTQLSGRKYAFHK